MKSVLFAGIFLMITMPLFGQTTSATNRVSVFSTSTDWQAVTGLQLGQYRGKFIGEDKKLIANGLELYYLDSFPCYGLGYGVRTWVGPNGARDGELQIACVYPPQQLSFAYRNVKQNADQGTSTGQLTCSVVANGRDLEIDLTKCNKIKNWSEYK